MKSSSVIALVIFSVAIFSVFFVFEVKQFLDLKQEKLEVEKRMEKLAARRDRLNSLSGAEGKNAPDREHLERLIREKLGLIKGDEKIFIFGN